MNWPTEMVPPVGKGANLLPPRASLPLLGCELPLGENEPGCGDAGGHMTNRGLISRCSSSAWLREFLQSGASQTCYTLESPWGSFKKYHSVAATPRHCDLRSFCLKLPDFSLFFFFKIRVPFLCSVLLWSCLRMGLHVNAALFWCLVCVRPSSLGSPLRMWTGLGLSRSLPQCLAQRTTSGFVPGKMNSGYNTTFLMSGTVTTALPLGGGSRPSGLQQALRERWKFNQDSEEIKEKQIPAMPQFLGLSRILGVDFKQFWWEVAGWKLDEPLLGSLPGGTNRGFF